MTREKLKELFDLSLPPCSEAVEWASKQEDQSVEGLLAACQNHEWRGFVAQYSRSAAILERLARDEDWRVRSAVASNPNTSTVVLEQLAEDRNRGVRSGVAYNPKAPTAILERMAQNGNWWVRGGVAHSAIATLSLPEGGVAHSAIATLSLPEGEI